MTAAKDATVVRMNPVLCTCMWKFQKFCNCYNK